MTPWDLHQIKPNLFRVPPCVISGTRAEASQLAVPLPSGAERWSGRLPSRGISWELAAPRITRAATSVEVARDKPSSPYHCRFANGATLFPGFS